MKMLLFAMLVVTPLSAVTAAVDIVTYAGATQDNPDEKAANTAIACIAGSDLATGFDVMRRRDFDCGPDRYSVKADRIWARINVAHLTPASGAWELQGDGLYLEGAAVFAVFADKTVQSARYSESEIVENMRPRGRYRLLVPGMSGEKDAAPTPKLETIYVAFDRPWSITTVKPLILKPVADAEAIALPIMVMFGLLMGLALMPLLYNILFFAALRYRFLVWHSITILATLAYTFSSSGIIFIIFPDVGTLPRFWMNYWSLALGVSGGVIFLTHYLEPKMISPMMRRTLFMLCAVPLITTLIVLHTGDWARFDGRHFYHASFLPILLALVLAMSQAFRRGSRAVKFSIAAWLPIILLAGERIGRGLDVFQGFSWMDYGLYMALVLETLLVAMGVIDRIITLRQEHQNSVERAEQMEVLAETDGLTGLANRRGFDRMFAEAHSTGSFDELAILDIDHFKQVNDLYGHEWGDNVLRTIGAILADSEVVAARIGGEEFALLLRSGDKESQNLEALCQRLTIMIAVSAPHIKDPVTVSMGVAPIFRSLPARSIIALADRRLYSAKRAGRNRIERGYGVDTVNGLAKAVA